MHHGQLLIKDSIPNVREQLGLGKDSGLVEMICSVTGIDPKDVSLDVAQDNMLPYKKIGGEEE